jgi:hypothetical protein
MLLTTGTGVTNFITPACAPEPARSGEPTSSGWVDVPRGTNRNAATMTLQMESYETFQKISQTGGWRGMAVLRNDMMKRGQLELTKYSI